MLSERGLSVVLTEPVLFLAVLGLTLLAKDIRSLAWHAGVRDAAPLAPQRREISCAIRLAP